MEHDLLLTCTANRINPYAPQVARTCAQQEDSIGWCAAPLGSLLRPAPTIARQLQSQLATYGPAIVPHQHIGKMYPALNRIDEERETIPRTMKKAPVVVIG